MGSVTCAGNAGAAHPAVSKADVSGNERTNWFTVYETGHKSSVFDPNGVQPIGPSQPRCRAVPYMAWKGLVSVEEVEVVT
jgi:hypothetical protein